MSVRKPARLLVWAPWLMTLLFVAVHLALPSGSTGSDGSEERALTLLLTLQALTFATVGLVIGRALPRHSIAWLFASVGVLVGLYLAAGSYQHYALGVRSRELPLAELAAWSQTWLYVPALSIFIFVLPQVFPTGRPISRRWRPALWLAGAAGFAMVLSGALAPGPLSQSTIDNPFGIARERHERLDEVASTLFFLAAILGFVALVARWRRAGGPERQQLKWFAYFATLLPVFVVVNGVIEVSGLGEPLAGVVAITLAVPTFLGLPIATAVSVLRYRLYDIDVVINRTLVYGSLSAALVGSYLGMVLLFRLLLSPLTGESDLAVAGSTIAVAALFRPLRSRIQSTVDRRFYRERYDAVRTLDGFSARLRDELDLAAVAADLRGVAHETMQPAHVSLWLRSPT